MLSKQGTVLWSNDHLSIEDLNAIATKIADELTSHGPFFCLWMQGDLGAGKTTLTGHILNVLGLPSEVPVLSPTFTFLNDYKIGHKAYAHLDFYRADAGGVSAAADLFDYENFDGLFIEWPSHIIFPVPSFKATHLLTITKSEDNSSRHYQFLRV